MTTKRLSNEFMEKILNDAAWNELVKNFRWTEQTLERYKDKVDWKEISDNSEILWTPSMLDKFKNRIDWTKLSSTSSMVLLNEANLERFKSYWDWSILSDNNHLHLTTELIEKYVDLWDWSQLIDRYNEEGLYTFEFLEKYIDRVPTDRLQNSQLWYQLVETRKFELAYEVLS